MCKLTWNKLLSNIVVLVMSGFLVMEPNTFFEDLLHSWSQGGGDSSKFMTGVIMSGHFLRPPDMLTKILKDPKHVDQIFRPKITYLFAFSKYQTDSEFETPKNYFLALKISDPKYVNLLSILDPKYLFSPKNLRPQICSSFLNFRPQNVHDHPRHKSQRVSLLGSC